MKQLYRSIKLAHRYLRILGFRQCLKYYFCKQGELAKIQFNDKIVFLRRGSPDLEVAASCFGGEFEILRNLVPQNYTGTIIDAGGYIGTATLALRELFPYARIITIEPSTDNLSVMKLNLKAISNYQIIEGALLGSQNTSDIILRDRGTGQWGYTTVDSYSEKSSDILVKSYTLSDLVADIRDVAILKLDIEGGEYDLFQSDNLMCEIPIIYVELHDKIIEGCEEVFKNFSKDRVIIHDGREKWLSLGIGVFGINAK